VELPPTLAQRIESPSGLIGRDQEGPQRVGERARLGAEREPARLGIEGRAVRKGQQRPKPPDLAFDLGAGHSLHRQEILEALRPGGVDDEDDLRLLHEVVDKLGRGLPLACRDRGFDLRDGGHRLIGGAAEPHSLAELV
jgi:hypothetical protein